MEVLSFFLLLRLQSCLVLGVALILSFRFSIFSFVSWLDTQSCIFILFLHLPISSHYYTILSSIQYILYLGLCEIVLDMYLDIMNAM